MATQMQKWRARRDAALRAMDVAAFQRECPDCPADVAEIAMHKARYELPSMPRALRLESGEWLRARGYGRLKRGDILPAGELP
ncbi:MAG: hypothetical protein B7Y09_09330 [Polaromonas sp. 24-63-21]|jgi:hypothetical protein|nr:MAG: hypothetical protein B7Y09_09330 [Polaromonas sp. 24-63-21]